MTTATDGARAGDPGRPPRRAGGAAVVVGVLGEVLITLGVLLALFVVWQLWWTDVVADGEQARVVEDLGWAVTEPDVPAAEPTATAEPEPRTDAAPVLAEPGHLTTFATLQVPRWGPDYVRPISQGTSRRDVLDVLGLGHYEGTAMPGGVGNFAVAGHRTTYGKPLNRVEELQVGDPLVVQTQDTWYVYRVTSTQVVLPHQVEVIAPVPNQPDAAPTERWMTLTTCHPMFSARERFIVHATLDHWLPVAEGVPAELTTAVGGA
ncbi:class E sortase [Actinotalea solisilvae]|uniref:class E sortase n=1 Tax=Actinotalea solisilvae TaxID=2072922 RepID=UPI0018F1DABC|nr:class E sortase [Actinotalea solisilvae]